MKYRIDKNLKMTVLSIIVILVSACSLFLYRELAQQLDAGNTHTRYSYSYKSNIDYKVNLKPNNIYRSNSLDGGNTYIAELVESIDSNFTYELKSDRELVGSYSIIARVEGKVGRGQDIKTIWVREFPMLINRNFKSANGRVLISEDITIDYDKFNHFVIEASDSTGIDYDANLIIEMNIDFNDIDSTKSYMLIPLGEPLFEITTETVEYPALIDLVTETPSLKNPRVIIYGILIGLGVLGLIFTIFFTKAEKEKDNFTKELDRIFKKYGDRLVAIKSNLSLSGQVDVRSMEDLIRLADELNRPILYKYSDNPKEINKFFISHANETYVFNLKQYIEGESHGSYSSQVSTN